MKSHYFRSAKEPQFEDERAARGSRVAGCRPPIWDNGCSERHWQQNVSQVERPLRTKISRTLSEVVEYSLESSFRKLIDESAGRREHSGFDRGFRRKPARRGAAEKRRKGKRRQRNRRKKLARGIRLPTVRADTLRARGNKRSVASWSAPLPLLPIDSPLMENIVADGRAESTGGTNSNHCDKSAGARRYDRGRSRNAPLKPSIYSSIFPDAIQFPRMQFPAASSSTKPRNRRDVFRPAARSPVIRDIHGDSINIRHSKPKRARRGEASGTNDSSGRGERELAAARWEAKSP